MTLRLQLPGNTYLHFISVYAPTLPSPDEDKAKFYEELRHVLERIPTKDKVALLGDFNARVGTEFDLWDGVLGRHGVGKCNANGLELLTLCAENDLCITNTCFRLPDKYKTSWMHPRSRHWHLLDYVIVRKSDLKDVHITRAMRGAQGWTDHRLIRSKLSVTLRPPRRSCHKNPAKLDVAKLVYSEQLQKKFDDGFGAVLSEPTGLSVDEMWCEYAETLRTCALQIIGKPCKRNQDWFDESDVEVKKLVEDYRLVLSSQASISDKRTAQKRLKLKVRELKDRWWAKKAKELQAYADSNQTGKFFEGIQAVFGPKIRKSAPIYSRDKQCQLTDQQDLLARWAEHFNEILNPDAQCADLAYISMIKTLPECEDLADPPTFDEFLTAVKKLKNSKTPGADSLPTEVYKYGGPNIKCRLYNIILHVWESDTVPQDWRDASICKLYKGKGSVSDCSSYRGISLLSTAGKVLAHILNTRLGKLAERLLPETQCGFRPNRGTVDAIFVVKQMQEKSLEQNSPLYMCFVDLEKAFDRVPREALWVILSKSGCPEKFTNLIRQFHDNMRAQVMHERSFSESFPVTSGVKQGCVMAPSMFSLYFAAVLNDALGECSGRIQLNVRTDRSVFDISRFRAKSQSTKLSIMDVLYADDVCLMADSMEALQCYMDALQKSCLKFGLVISVAKTQVLKQPARGCDADASTLNIDGTNLEEVTSFRYLGSQIGNDNRLSSEIPARIARAAATFGKLNQRVWKSHDITLQTKLAVYRALVLPILLYASETWCLYKGDIRKLDAFHVKCLRSILRIKWQDRVTNADVLRRSQTHGIEALLMKGQLRWCGHVQRMDDCRLPKSVFYSELSKGKRSSGGQYLRYKDVFKRNLTSCNLPTEKWEEVACTRSIWRSKVKKGVSNFEDDRLSELDLKRQTRKNRPKPSYNYTYNSVGQLYCAACDRVFKTKFGFASHIRAHARR